MSQRPMRVVIVTPGAFPIPSGKSSSVEQVVEKTAEKLVKFMPVYVLGRRTAYQPKSEVRGGCRYIRVPYRGSRSYISAVSQQIAKLKPGIIQVENRPHFVHILRKRYPRSMISLVLHSKIFISKPYISKKFLRACLAAADVVIVNSDYMKQAVQEKAPSAAHKIVTQHLGVDVSKFTSRWSPEGSESRIKKLQELGYENRKIILYVGRLIPRKGVHHLMKAMKTVIEKEPDAVLILVGGAFYGSKRLTEYVKSLYREGSKMPQNVKFIPYMSHADIPKWFQLADVVVVPSGEGEAFGLVNIEAMASGVPVVATNSGGIGEVIKSGTVGYLVDLDKVESDLPRYLLRLLADGELRRAMGEQGIQRTQQLFTWDKAAEQRHDLYKDKLGR
ncbi:glycosyltransferase family 4 protein [Paenibacillus planticolens]|uniref:glycosyltransferase family 4 protein n=1 Tax=Paenibacillus planticolens TaxID=2654976 RepID=UPI0028AA3E85|nr:glycosyltransferase family 4 protein [Paenibacillus planticolens]